MTVADRIKARREYLCISQEDLAAKLGLKDKSSISKIESSGDKVSLKNIEKLAPLLNCSVQYLMGWENKEPAEADSNKAELLTVYDKLNPAAQEQLVKIAKTYLQS